MAEERKQKVNAEAAAPAPTGLWKKAAIALLVLAVFGAAYYVGYHKRTHKYDAFARCLKDRQVKMYGAYWCPHCAEQKEMFGESLSSRRISSAVSRVIAGLSSRFAKKRAFNISQRGSFRQRENA